jgi:hypothetical protein
MESSRAYPGLFFARNRRGFAIVCPTLSMFLARAHCAARFILSGRELNVEREALMTYIYVDRAPHHL